MFYNITSRFTYICIARGLYVRFTTHLQGQVAAFCQPAKILVNHGVLLL